MNRIIKTLIIILLTIITLMIFSINISPWYIPNTNTILDEILSIIKEFDISITLIGVFIFSFYYKTYFDNTKFTKKNILMIIISIILSMIIVISKILQIDPIGEKTFTSFTHFLRSLIMFFGYYLIFYSIIKNLFKIDIKKYLKNQKKKSNKVLTYIDNHPVLTTSIFLTICILPYLIIYFPFTANGDTFDSLCQIFHNSNSWTIEAINLKNPNVYLNTHHPLLFTLIYGLIVKIGIKIHSLTLGVFIYTILQTILSISVFTYLIVYLKKIKIPVNIRILLLLFIGLTPTIQVYTTTAIKDTPNALFTILYIIFLLEIIRNPKEILENNNKLIKLGIIIFLIIALRNNGIITILMSYIPLFILYKKYNKRLLITLLIPIIILLSFNNIMYNFFDVSKGSKRELFSVPFMQIARLIRNDHDKELSKQDIKYIDKVIKYKSLKEDYYPSISDPVKDNYRKNATNKDLKNFFKVWFKYLCKHPNIYIKSFIASTNEYFYTDGLVEYGMLGIHGDLSKNFKIIELPKSRENRGIFKKINIIIYDIPIIGLIYRVATFDLILIFSTIYIIYKKKYKYLIPLLPLISILLICLVSPLNGSMRYILPIVYSIPMVIVIDYLVLIKKTN